MDRTARMVWAIINPVPRVSTSRLERNGRVCTRRPHGWTCETKTMNIANTRTAHSVPAPLRPIKILGTPPGSIQMPERDITGSLPDTCLGGA